MIPGNLTKKNIYIITIAMNFDDLHVNHKYLLKWCNLIADVRSNAKFLDYGCGVGETVIVGRQMGLNLVGTEAFYEGGSSRETLEQRGALHVTIFELEDGKPPFEDHQFDMVVNNQVLEHVEDLDAVLGEINRVLKPGGLCLALFPSKEVWREGHVGIPFVHWFPKNSRLRAPYMYILRSLGLGYFKNSQNRRQWVRAKLDWLDRFTYYRHRSEILHTFRRHFSELQMKEADYIRFRLTVHPWLRFSAGLADIPGLDWLLSQIFRRLGGMVILATKESADRG